MHINRLEKSREEDLVVILKVVVVDFGKKVTASNLGEGVRG